MRGRERKIDRVFGTKTGIRPIGLLISVLTVILSFVFSLHAARPTHASSISINISTDNLRLNIIPDSENGTFGRSGQANISVSTDNEYGYTLDIKAKYSQDLIGTGTASGGVFQPIPSTITANDFSSSTSYNNKWGYCPSKFNSEDNTVNQYFYPAPTTTGDILDVTKAPNPTANNYTIEIGARADLSTKVGEYSNVFIISAVANPEQSICNPTATSIHDAICMQDVNKDVVQSMNVGHKYSLIDSRDKREYYIARQADGKVWMTENLDIDLTKFTTLTSQNTNLTEHQYTSGGTTRNYTNYTENDGIIAWTLPNSLKTAATINTSTSAISGYTESTNAPYMAKTINPSSTSEDADVFTYYDASTNVDKIYIGLSECIADGHDEEDCDHYKVGKYYNWSAAVASSASTEYGYSATGVAAPNSICPAGWKLPDGYISGTASEFNTLLYDSGVVKLPSVSGSDSAVYTDGNPSGSSLIRSEPIYFTMSGYMNRTSLNSFGSSGGGYYWSNTAASANNAHILFFGINTPRPAQSVGKSPGRTIRCVATESEEGSSDTTFNEAFANAGATMEQGFYKMQTPPANICDAVSIGQVGQLIDTRDNSVYYVAKMADEKCWMLDNLRLGSDSTINLTPTDTNITSSFTLPSSISSGFDSYETAQINSTHKDDILTSFDSGSGKVGAYYNFCAASGGTYCFPSDSSTGNAENDICPAGWRMPTGGSSGEYQALYQLYSGDYTSFKNSLAITLSGFYNGSSRTYYGFNGDIWSSTRSSNSNMFRMRSVSNNVYPAGNDTRNLGRSVRCIMK